MRVILVALTTGIFACSSSSSKNGWDLDDIEIEIEKIYDQLDEYKVEIDRLTKENSDLQGRVFRFLPFFGFGGDRAYYSTHCYIL